MNQISAIILAGGKGTRMMSETPKVLHHIVDKPMVFYTIEHVKQTGIEKIYVLVSHKAEEVKKSIENYFMDSRRSLPRTPLRGGNDKWTLRFAYQDQPLGTGHALKCAFEQIPQKPKAVLVLNGDDSAFYSIETLQSFIKTHFSTNATVSMISLKKPGINTVGKIFRDDMGKFKEFLESYDYNRLGLYSDEINCGAYIFDSEWLGENLEQIELSSKGEYIINGYIKAASEQEKHINIFQLQNEDEWVGVNTKEELDVANTKMKQQVL